MPRTCNRGKALYLSPITGKLILSKQRPQKAFLQIAKPAIEGSAILVWRYTNINNTSQLTAIYKEGVFLIYHKGALIKSVELTLPQQKIHEQYLVEQVTKAFQQ